MLLHKIPEFVGGSGRFHRIEAVKRQDVSQLFIDNPQEKKKKQGFSFNSLFATHPPIEKRISLLEQF